MDYTIYAVSYNKVSGNNSALIIAHQASYAYYSHCISMKSDKNFSANENWNFFTVKIIFRVPFGSKKFLGLSLDLSIVVPSDKICLKLSYVLVVGVIVALADANYYL
jgi:hypothetical protein